MQRCVYCSRKSALHQCTTCKVFLHAPTASRALQNTSGKDWQCFAEYHTADGHKNSYECHKSQNPNKKRNRPEFIIPESVAKMTANTAQFAHNKSKRKKAEKGRSFWFYYHNTTQ